MSHSRPATTEAARTDVLQECQGFTSSSGLWHKLLALPAVKLLQGIAPHTAAWLLCACALQHADYTLVKLLDGRQYLLKVHTLSLEQNSTSQSTVEIDRKNASISGQLRGFRLFLKMYVYNLRTDTFDPVPGMPDHLPHQICQASKALQQIETAGADWQTFNLGQKQKRRDMLRVYGNQKRLVPPRRFFGVTEAKRKEVLAIFLMQVLEEIYLLYRGRYFYPVLICAFSFPALVGLAALLTKQHKKVMALMNECRLTPMVQERWVRATSSHRLVPGDVIVLHSGRALCDMVLLRGACLVTEAMLSGEADQLRKTAFVCEEGKDYDPEKHRSCTIYAGTMVQQVWNPSSSEDEVLVMVCRTGLDTAMGSIIRELLVPAKATQKDPVVADILHLYLFALVLQSLIFIPYMIKASQHAQSAKLVIWRLLDVLIFAAPPGLPLVLMLVGAVAQSVLVKDGVLLLRPETIRPGAAVDMVCFDKTGTLTSSMADLHGVVPVNEAVFGKLEQTAFRWGSRLRQMFAVCHSLNMVSRSTVAGADLERKLFKAVEASFLDRETILLPHPRRSPQLLKLSIVRVLEFSSQTLRSGAVVLSDDAPAGCALLFLRGAPAVIRSLVRPASVPRNFDQVMDDYSSQSFRVLAGAVGVIRNVDKLDLARMTQQQLEGAATNLHLLGLVVLANSLRPDSKETIGQVQDEGGIRTMMITGDYHHTAVAVARDLGMLKPQDSVMLLDIAAEAQQPLDPSLLSPLSPPALAWPALKQHKRAAEQALDVGPCQSQLGQQPVRLTQAALAVSSKQVKWGGALESKTDRAEATSLLSAQMQMKRKSALLQMPLHRDSADSLKHGLAPFPQRPSIMSPNGFWSVPRKLKQSFSPLQARPNRDGSAQSAAAPSGQRLPVLVTPGSSLEGLTFQPLAEVKALGAPDALAALAEGQMQCAVTGDAFEHLLQHHDLSVLETVLRSTVVFSRMQPHQKGQVMDLLGSRGIHQLFVGQLRHIQGLGLTTMFCGDGINDLAALAAADVGMAIGAEAVVAAELSTTKASVAGVANFIKVCKGGWAMIGALFKYVVVFQCILAQANMTAFFVDGSYLSNWQMTIIDLQAMAMALACCWVPPLKKMNRHKPPPCTCSFAGLALMASAALALQILHICLMLFLCLRPWFTGGNGSARLNPVASSAWLAAQEQLLLPLVTLTINTRSFCEPLWRSKPVLVTVVIYATLSFVTDLVRPPRHLNLLNLYNFPQSFRWQYGMIAGGGILAYVAWMGVTRVLLSQRQQRKIQP